MNIMVIKIAATVMIVAAAGVVIWLLLRSIRLWYWRTDEITGTIKEMGNKIDSLEKGLDNVKVSTEKLVSETREVNAKLEFFDAELRRLGEYGQRQEFRKCQIEGGKDYSDAGEYDGNPGLEERGIINRNSDGENKVNKDTRKDGAGMSGEEIPVMSQVEELEKELESLKKEKEKLKAEINARIRD